MIRVVIADDQHLIREAIRVLLEREPDIEVIGEAQNGIEAVELAKQLLPDVLILDINMPRLDGLEATRRISELRLPIQVLILSMYSEDSLIKNALRSGARGYVLKGSVAGELRTAIRKLSQNLVYLSPEVASEVNLNEKSESDAISQQEIRYRLSPREREIFKLIADGYTNGQIANMLFISIKTVEKHRANLMVKLGVHDTASLVRKAVELKLIFIER